MGCTRHISNQSTQSCFKYDIFKVFNKGTKPLQMFSAWYGKTEVKISWSILYLSSWYCMLNRMPTDYKNRGATENTIEYYSHIKLIQNRKNDLDWTILFGNDCTYIRISSKWQIFPLRRKIFPFWLRPVQTLSRF